MTSKSSLAERLQVGKSTLAHMVPPQVSILDERYFGKTKRAHLREFAQVFALIFLVIGGGRLYHYGWVMSVVALLCATATVLYLGYYKPLLLHPAWKAWMKLGHALGAVMSVLMLSLAWIVMVIPASWILRLFRVRIMDASFRTPVSTYWEDRDSKDDDFALLRRQF